MIYNEIIIDPAIFTLDLNAWQVIMYSILKNYPDKYWTTLELEQLLHWSKQRIWRELAYLTEEVGCVEKRKIIDDNNKAMMIYKFYDTSEEDYNNYLAMKAKGEL